MTEEWNRYNLKIYSDNTQYNISVVYYQAHQPYRRGFYRIYLVDAAIDMLEKNYSPGNATPYGYGLDLDQAIRGFTQNLEKWVKHGHF